MSRLDPIDSSNFSKEQLELYQEIVAGPRNADFGGKLIDKSGNLTGPFDLMIRSPYLGKHLSRLGEALRFKGPLSLRYVEFLILKIAAQWKCQYEWYIHHNVAINSGLEVSVIDSIKSDKPLKTTDPGILLLDKLSDEILLNKVVSDSTFIDCRKMFSEPEIIHIAALLGYYTSLAIWLNLFEVNVGPDLFL